MKGASILVKPAIVVWVTGVILAGFLVPVPAIPILEHTARNLYFHVPLWFALMAAFFVSGWYSVRVLSHGRLEDDIRASEAALVGVAFGLLGLVTGMVWARFTWYVGTNKWWNNDPKQVMAAVQIMIYAAYFVLRNSFDEPTRRARISAVYNLFAAATVPFLLYVLPRQLESLHPGGDGNPAFDEVTDPAMRLIFYPAIIGSIALFWWIYSQRTRIALIEESIENEDYT
jgi:heme exporter protein C